MKLRITYFILFVFFNSLSSKAQTVNNFDFIFKYLGNTYNSKTKIFTKDMVVGPSISFKIKLSKSEKQAILQKLIAIDFWNYPDIYRFESAEVNHGFASVQPCFNYSMTILSKSEKKVSWDDCESGHSKKELFEKLEGLHSLIENIISKKNNYIKSPAARGAYL